MSPMRGSSFAQHEGSRLAMSCPAWGSSSRSAGPRPVLPGCQRGPRGLPRDWCLPSGAGRLAVLRLLEQLLEVREFLLELGLLVRLARQEPLRPQDRADPPL